MPTFEYFDFKLIDIEARLNWVGDVLSALPSGTHPQVVKTIEQLASRISHQASLLKRLLSTQRASYLPRIRIDYQTIEADLEKISAALLVPLLSEGPREKTLTPILCRLCQEVRLDHITDSLIMLGAPLATIPITYECPIFRMPYEITHSLRDWPALYHEAGHALFSTSRQRYLGNLLSVIRTHFGQIVLAAGPMPEPAKSSRLRAIRSAEKYWTDIRLEELFCDCFGAYCLGLSYAFLWTDLAFRRYSSPQEINLRDDHPPPRARFDCIWYCLPDSLKRDPCGQAVRSIWEAYLGGTVPASSWDSLIVDYGLACSVAVIQALAEKSLDLIRSTSTLSQYNEPIPAAQQALTLSPSDSLARLLNAATGVLLLQPASYREFQDRLLKQLVQNQS